MPDLLSKYYERKWNQGYDKGRTITFEEVKRRLWNMTVPVYTRLRELANKVNGYDQEASNLYTEGRAYTLRALDYPMIYRPLRNPKSL